MLQAGDPAIRRHRQELRILDRGVRLRLSRGFEKLNPRQPPLSIARQHYEQVFQGVAAADRKLRGGFQGAFRHAFQAQQMLHGRPGNRLLKNPPFPFQFLDRPGKSFGLAFGIKIELAPIRKNAAPDGSDIFNVQPIRLLIEDAAQHLRRFAADLAGLANLATQRVDGFVSRQNPVRQGSVSRPPGGQRQQPSEHAQFFYHIDAFRVPLPRPALRPGLSKKEIPNGPFGISFLSKRVIRPDLNKTLCRIS